MRPSCAPGQGSRDCGAVTGEDGLERRRTGLPQVEVAVGDDGVDHAGETEALAVLGAEDRDAGVAQAGDLLGDDDAATAADDADVAGAVLLEQLHEVLEVLDVATLVGADGDALHVLLDRRVDDLLDRAVVPEVDDLGALRLHDPPHDVDRRVVPVEEAAGGDEPHVVRRALVRVARCGCVRHEKIVGLPTNGRQRVC